MYHETTPNATIIWYYDGDSFFPTRELNRPSTGSYELGLHFNKELQGRVNGSS